MENSVPASPAVSEGTPHVGLAEFVERAHERWNWRWRSWTRWPLSWPIVLVALLTVVVDVATAWMDVSLGTMGRVPMSPALPLGVVLACMVGLRRLGLDPANRRAWREFLIVSSAALLWAAYSYAVNIGGTEEAVGLVLAALGEELVYRLAVLIVVGALVAKLTGHNWRNAEDWGPVAGISALIAGGVIFTALPGHVAQMNSALTALPFASLGVVLGYAVLRTGALFPAVVVHAFLNIATIAVLAGEVSGEMRAALALTALVALVSGTIVAGVRLGMLRKEPVAIDLRRAGTGG
ncbi:MAG: CPBP family intramembrane metalloprotease [Actinobacteria bacterium]|nr:CPBP family intramembrane metalloprotease [Actinomycetota bacterium]